MPVCCTTFNKSSQPANQIQSNLTDVFSKFLLGSDSGCPGTSDTIDSVLSSLSTTGRYLFITLDVYAFTNLLDPLLQSGRCEA